MIQKIKISTLKHLLEKAFELGELHDRQEIAMSDYGKIVAKKDFVNKKDAIKTLVAEFLGENIDVSEAPPKSETVTVCSSCLQASCWLNIFCCDDYKSAGTVEKTRKELRELSLEHPSYWEY